MKTRLVPSLVLALAIGLMCAAAAGLTRVAVVDFTDSTGKKLGLGPVASEILTAELAKGGCYELLERTKLQRILDEYNLSMSGLADNEQNLLKIGKILNADAMITGVVLEFNEKRTTTTAYGINTTKVSFNLEVSVRKFDVATSRITFANIFSASQDVVLTGTGSTTGEMDRQLLKRALAKAAEALACPPAPPPPPPPPPPLSTDFALTVNVTFNSNPLGAAVYIDGVYAGVTPLTVPLAEGIHTVRIVKEGFTTSEYKLNVTRGMGTFNVTMVP